jgi:hypothetical protein
MTEDRDVLHLPEDFIGNEDRTKLESFAAHLIAHGRATRWHWIETGGVAVALQIFSGGARAEKLMVRIARDRTDDCFYAEDAAGARLADGRLEAIMTVIDSFARERSPDPSV